MKIKFYIKTQDGFIMVTTIVFMVISLSFISVYYVWVGNKNRQLEFRIASTKAHYNAESGIAIDGYPTMVSSDIEVDTTLNINQKLTSNFYGNEISMGTYRDPSIDFPPPSLLGNLRIATAIGKSTINSPTSSVDVERISYLVGVPPSLGEHTDLILSELGYNRKKIKQLHSDGVVFSTKNSNSNS